MGTGTVLPQEVIRYFHEGFLPIEVEQAHCVLVCITDILLYMCYLHTSSEVNDDT